MNQIAIGDGSTWTVIEGASILAPYKHAIPFFAMSSDPFVDEHIEIHLTGTPTQISAALATLEHLVFLADLHSKGQAGPVYIRYQPESGGAYFYTVITRCFITSNPAGYKTHYTGSIILFLHYARENCFYSAQVELPLNGRFGENFFGGVPIFNHTDAHSSHGSSVYLKPANLSSPLPPALRIELYNNYATNQIKDVFIGIYHHPDNDDEDPFFVNAPDMSGGSLLFNVNAINEYYRRLTWSATTWTALASATISTSDSAFYDGRTFRPFFHLYNSHAYSDLYFRVKIQSGSYVLYTSDPIYADPNYDYLFFPALEIPTNKVLRELTFHGFDFVLYGYKATAAVYTIDIDQLQFFPCDYSANFYGFFPADQNDTFIDDNFSGISVIKDNAISELVAHVRQGGKLYARPSAYNRLNFILATNANTVDIMRTAIVRIYCRNRYRIL